MIRICDDNIYVHYITYLCYRCEVLILHDVSDVTFFTRANKVILTQPLKCDLFQILTKFGA